MPHSLFDWAQHVTVIDWSSYSNAVLQQLNIKWSCCKIRKPQTLRFLAVRGLKHLDHQNYQCYIGVVNDVCICDIMIGQIIESWGRLHPAREKKQKEKHTVPAVNYFLWGNPSTIQNFTRKTIREIWWFCVLQFHSSPQNCFRNKALA